MKKKDEKPEEWKSYKLRMTVEVMKSADGGIIVKDGKGREWSVSNDELLKHYKAI